MKNVIGDEITITLFGESHGPAIGCVLDGLPSGFHINEDELKKAMRHRSAVGSISTARKEPDEVQFLSGVREGVTEGTPVAIVIANTNTHSKDYDAIADLARPGHADYAAEMRYGGYQDKAGGGHFSGRLTAPLAAAGEICRQMLQVHGIRIGSHIASLHGIRDDRFDEDHLNEQIDALNDRQFAVLNDEIAEKMMQEIEEARKKQDSVGGILETAVTGLEAGIGEPEFESVESRLSEAIFSIPAVKGIEFGEGFGFADLYGSQANDAFAMKDGKIVTLTNHNGGINGGISNGMPVLFRTVIKPTPSIAQRQKTVNMKTREDALIEIRGRHDPAIVHRARAVVDAMSAFVIADMLTSAHGRKWMVNAE